MSEVQAVYFKKKKFNSEKARKWLDEHDFVRMKRVDKTPNLLRYRITDPKQYKFFITKELKGKNKGISLVIGFK